MSDYPSRLIAGIVQAINLDLLHPIGYELQDASHAKGRNCLALVKVNLPSEPLFSAEELASEKFVAERIAYIEFRHASIVHRLGAGEDISAIYQTVVGGYCQQCGCTNDSACNDGGQPCYWHAEPDANGPGLCSACHSGDDDEVLS